MFFLISFVSSAPLITIDNPINSSLYKISSVDLNWNVNETIDWCGYSLDGTANNTDILSLDLSVWNTSYNDGLTTGLTSIPIRSHASFFEINGTWYAIIGFETTYAGYKWTGSTWQSNASIINGLVLFSWATPEVFYKNGTWYLISGDSGGKFSGNNWTGTTWQNDTAIINGLIDVGQYASPSVFQKDGTWYLLSGSLSTIIGFNWTGTSWQSDTGIVNGLAGGSNIKPVIFEKDGTWYLIAGIYGGTFNGYNWTGTTWQSDTAIIDGLGDVGSNPAPEVFEKNDTWYLLAGRSQAGFVGFGKKIEKEGINTTLTSLVDGEHNLIISCNNTNGDLGTGIVSFSIFVPIFEGEFVGSGNLYNIMRSFGAGLGLFFTYLTIGLPVLLIGLAFVGIIIVIGMAIAHLVNKFKLQPK